LHLYSTSIYNKTFLPIKQSLGKPPPRVKPKVRLLHRLRCLYIITYYTKPEAAPTKQRIFSKPVEIFNKLLLQFFDYLDKLLYVQHQGPYFSHRVEIETFLAHVINSKYENFFKYTYLWYDTLSTKYKPRFAVIKYDNVMLTNSDWLNSAKVNLYFWCWFKSIPNYIEISTLDMLSNLSSFRELAVFCSPSSYILVSDFETFAPSAFYYKMYLQGIHSEGSNRKSLLWNLMKQMVTFDSDKKILRQLVLWELCDPINSTIYNKPLTGRLEIPHRHDQRFYHKEHPKIFVSQHDQFPGSRFLGELKFITLSTDALAYLSCYSEKFVSFSAYVSPFQPELWFALLGSLICFNLF